MTEPHKYSPNFHSMIGFGVAGNFTGHLEQAGEDKDFLNIKVEDQSAPKGLFPFYLPSKSGLFIEEYPLSSQYIIKPHEEQNLQIEPEIALICMIEYEDKQVKNVTPQFFTAYNDCSIRKPNAKKISEKKNWGRNSKGISKQLIEIDNFQEGGSIDAYHIASYLLRNNQLHAYGLDSAAIGYSYFHQKLLNWIVEKMNTQQDEGPLESIPQLLKRADYPSQAIISIGATRYTHFGENNFLKVGDEIFVVVYNAQKYSSPEIEKFLINNELPSQDISVLHQQVTS